MTPYQLVALAEAEAEPYKAKQGGAMDLIAFASGGIGG
jgi:hypothetical protein